jgi:hypothetical protein
VAVLVAGRSVVILATGRYVGPRKGFFVVNGAGRGVGLVGSSHVGLSAPFVQQYLPLPLFTQQSLFEAPFSQQNGALPPLEHCRLKQ